MYNGHEYLSCIKIPAEKQAMTKVDRSKKVDMDLEADYRDLISTANKVFGEGKWNHTVINQALDFVESVGAKCCTGCVTRIKVQLENGNFHEDVGYCSAEESTKGLSIHNARIGSAVNTLKRVLLAFGDKIERELQKLQRQSSFEQANDVQTRVPDKIPGALVSKKMPSNKEQANDVQKSVTPFDKQIPEKSISNNFNFKVPSNKKQADDVQKNLMHCKSSDKQISEESIQIEISVPVSSLAESKVEPIGSNEGPAIVPTTGATVKLNECVALKCVSDTASRCKIFMPFPNEKNSSTDCEQKSNQALSVQEMQRLERKRKQMEKQMEFKRRMIEKESSKEESTDDNKKPNPKY